MAVKVSCHGYRVEKNREFLCFARFTNYIIHRLSFVTITYKRIGLANIIMTNCTGKGGLGQGGNL